MPQQRTPITTNPPAGRGIFMSRDQCGERPALVVEPGQRELADHATALQSPMRGTQVVNIDATEHLMPGRLETPRLEHAGDCVEDLALARFVRRVESWPSKHVLPDKAHAFVAQLLERQRSLVADDAYQPALRGDQLCHR